MSVLSTTDNLRWQVPESLLLQLLGLILSHSLSVDAAIYPMGFKGCADFVSSCSGLLMLGILLKRSIEGQLSG